MKWIGFAAVALALSSPAVAQEDVTIAVRAEALPTPYFMDLGLSHLIRCEVADGAYLGTGESISATDIATAYHVIAHGHCSIDGEPVTVVYTDKARDFAVVRTGQNSPRRITISCAGFREGEDYFAVGWAQGTDFVVQRLTGTNDVMSAKSRPWAMLRGVGFHGLSGGAIYDRDGRMAGIVNAGPEDGTPWLLSLPLSETYLCRSSVTSVDSGRAVR